MAGPRAIAAASALCVFVLLTAHAPVSAQARGAAFAWPKGARMALSLSFDDGRETQVTVGAPLFRRHKVAVTFFVVPSAVERRLDAWKQVVADGHEIGNHSLTHPCSGNFAFSRANALEDRTLARMRDELAAASERIRTLLGVTPRTFAYPCGQTFVGRGTSAASYVPLVAELFLAGRGWLDEAANDPAVVDLAQVMGVEMDGRDLADLMPMLESTRASGGWLVLAGHDIGEPGRQTTRTSMLDALLTLVKDPAQGIWLAPVGEVAETIRASRR
jgi:peptidoglycan/xylan/chitin deacetylase (PgdA/CDA1 family)